MGLIVSYCTKEPAAELRPFVCHYYRLQYDSAVGSGFTQDLVPNGSPDIFVSRDADIEVSDAGGAVLRSRGPLATGQLSKTIRVGFAGDTEVYGVTLHPLGLTALVSRGGHEIRDTIAELADINPDFSLALGRCALEPERPSLDSFAAGMDVVLRDTLRRANETPSWLAPMVRHMQRSAGLMPVVYYSDLVGRSERLLEHAFREHVGCSPKSLLRVIRFSKFLEFCSETGQPDLTTLALELGFFDQAHLCHEVRRMTGFCPQRYFSRLSEVLGSTKRASTSQTDA